MCFKVEVIHELLVRSRGPMSFFGRNGDDHYEFEWDITAICGLGKKTERHLGVCKNHQPQWWQIVSWVASGAQVRLPPLQSSVSGGKVWG